MGHVQIVIRYYDEEGAIVCEDEPNLGHRFRMPVHWARWELYWGEALVQSGEHAPEPPPVERRGGSGRPSRARGSR